MTPPFAVLFKCHYWDDYVQRQFDRLKAVIGRGDLFVIVNETDGPVAGITHPEERVLRITETAARALGLEHNGTMPMLWFSNDYHLHLFSRRWPDYAFYVMLEFDVVCNMALDSVIERLSRENVDFVGQPSHETVSEWFWRASCEGSYGDDVMLIWLVCFTIFSHRAAHLLYEKRRITGERIRSGELASIPFCEAAIPTELYLAGFKLMPLSAIGSTAAYSWTPPYSEAALEGLKDEAIVHPVLDRERFLRKIAAFASHMSDVMEPGSGWHRHYSRDEFDHILPHIFTHAWHSRNDALVSHILGTMREVEADEYRRLHGLLPDNLGSGKHATQSSRRSAAARADEASGALMGPVSGGFSFHTVEEERPWWMVDLGRPEPVARVRVFNHMAAPTEANGLELHVSADGRGWSLVGCHQGAQPFGGADGHPLEIEVGRVVRFVRLELPRRGTLHLDQVQVLTAASTASVADAQHGHLLPA